MRPTHKEFNLKEVLKNIPYCEKLPFEQRKYVYSEIKRRGLPNRALEAVLMHMHKEVTNAKLKRPFELVVEDAINIYVSGF